MYLQKGSVLCISQRVTLGSSVRGGDGLNIVSVHCVFNICRWCGICRGTCFAAGASGRTIWSGCNYTVKGSCEGYCSVRHLPSVRQSSALFWAPDIHSKVMFYVDSSSDHLFTLWFAFLPFRNFCRGLWLLHTTMSVPVDSSSTLLQHSKCHRLPVLVVLHFHWVSVNMWERNATGSFWPLCSCDN